MTSTLQMTLKTKASWFIAGYYKLILPEEVKDTEKAKVLAKAIAVAASMPKLTTQELTELALRLYPLEEPQVLSKEEK